MAQFTTSWFPTAAYLYVLHLDGAGLAWEYLRRNPAYRADWLYFHRQPEVAGRWGLRLMEDPALDARDAFPAWLPGNDAVVQLYRDFDPPPDARPFEFWRLAGTKHLVHDGQRLLLIARRPRCSVSFALAPELEDGMAYAYAIPAGPQLDKRYDAMSKQLARHSAAETAPGAIPRPSTTAVLELHTLQALDATLAGASMRGAAEAVFGKTAVASGWHADGGLRSRLRRLVRRGRSLMTGGYRRLVQLDSPGKGRSSRLRNDPLQYPRPC
ncbi:DNA -binding domain-containing protein [Pseudomonas aeruginosa]|uniref:DNA -binding domain-containing protein n=1 Tax=Pseudomonas aeruginosa TaxID=287 RepID=UPI00383BDE1D